jgi:hypothetical protein
VAAAQIAAAVHSETAAARWQQRGGSGRFAGTIHKCANARAFKCHRHAKIRVFVLGQGWRDDSVGGIVVGGSDGGKISTVVADVLPPPPPPPPTPPTMTPPTPMATAAPTTLFVKLNLI